MKTSVYVIFKIFRNFGDMMFKILILVPTMNYWVLRNCSQGKILQIVSGMCLLGNSALVCPALRLPEQNQYHDRASTK